MELILRVLTPVINFGEVRRAQLAKSTLLNSMLMPLGFSDLLRSVQMLKRERGCGKQQEATATIQSLVKLQPWFQSLR